MYFYPLIVESFSSNFILAHIKVYSYVQILN